MRRFQWAIPVTMVLASMFSTVGCQSTGGTTAETPAAPEMSMDEMMAMMQELGTPGDGHQRLEPMIGTFKATTTFWMEADAEPSVSEGTSTNEWMLDGRYVRSSFDGQMMGMPFQGMSVMGYNNGTGQYEGVWVDSMSTLIMPVSRGTVDDSGKVFTFHREADNMFPGMTVKMREVLTLIDNDRHTFEMFEEDAQGQERQSLEIVYQRVK